MQPPNRPKPYAGEADVLARSWAGAWWVGRCLATAGGILSRRGASGDPLPARLKVPLRAPLREPLRHGLASDHNSQGL
eukprot:1868209-Pyramimonas_sp.AAC.1